MRREVDLLRTLRDRNVVAFVGASLLPGATVLLTEYVAGGDLHAALAKDGRPGKGGKARVRRFTWAPDYVPAGRRPTGAAPARCVRRPGTGLNWGVAADVARALVYLHSRRPAVCHLDVKASNILLTPAWTAKLCDVGTARALRPDAWLSSLHEVGTFAWAAPEVLLGRRANEKADVYSFGVLLWALGAGVAPPGRALPPLDPQPPPDVQAVMVRCLDHDPAARPSMARGCGARRCGVAVAGGRRRGGRTP